MDRWLNKILMGSSLEVLLELPDSSIHCCVTSPPYWGLRDYGVEGQLGLEKTPEEYVQKMVDLFREVRRVLRDDGTLWLNLGDSYNGSGPSGGPGKQYTNVGSQGTTLKRVAGLKPKDLVGIPWRVAFALQSDGWYLRSDIIWSKPNPMPESVTDRPTKSHEYIFLLSKSPRYFYDADAVREEQTGNAHSRGKGLTPKSAPEGSNTRAKESWHLSTRDVEVPGGRNRRTVWVIATQPMPEAHFATFPEALVEPCISAGTSERGACPECGAPWRRVVERVRDHGLAPVAGGKTAALAETDRWNRLDRRRKAARAAGEDPDNPFGHGTTLGWQPTCTCGGDPVPCVVLDPFGGSGTVAKVARDLGRSSVLIELNPEYVAIMKKKLRVGEQLDTGVCEYVVREVRA